MAGRFIKLKKIFFASNTAWFLYNFRLSLIRFLINKGYVVYVCAPFDKYVALLVKNGCLHEEINLNRSGVNFFSEIILFISYIRILIRIKPNIVLSFTIKPVIYTSFACLLLNIKYICTVTGLGSSFISRGLLKYLLIFLYKVSLLNAQKIIFINKFDEKFFLENKIIKVRQSNLINGEGVDLNLFKYSEYIPKKITTFLFIGRLIADKGLYEYYSAACTIKKNYDNVIFQVLGPFDYDNKSSINSRIINSWHKNVEYLGESDNVIPYIINSTCVVLPSYREGSPKSLLESAAIGRPIITTNTPGCNEIVINHYNGYLCEPKNYSDLVRCMEIIINLDNNRIINLGRNGRKLVEDNYSDEYLIFNYAKLIEHYI